MPALYSLAFRRLLPESFAIVGAARTEEHRRRVPRADEAGGRGARARPVRRGGLGRSSPPGCATSTLDFADDRREDELRDTLTKLDEERGTRREPRLLLRGAAERDRARSSRRSRERRGAGGLDPADHREAVRARPRLGARAERRDPGALRRERDLPDRPLPRQGDGPEHAGAAVRERHLRADLEPPVHRPRADHGRRVDRDRGPRRLLRAGRRDPRHLPEPPAAAPRDHGDGAADRLHRRLGAQREGEGAEVAPHAGAEARRARPVRARASSRATRCAATARRRASRRAR